jgi:hypothetical protein
MGGAGYLCGAFAAAGFAVWTFYVLTVRWGSWHPPAPPWWHRWIEGVMTIAQLIGPTLVAVAIRRICREARTGDPAFDLADKRLTRSARWAVNLAIGFWIALTINTGLEVARTLGAGITIASDWILAAVVIGLWAARNWAWSLVAERLLVRGGAFRAARLGRALRIVAVATVVVWFPLALFARPLRRLLDTVIPEFGYWATMGLIASGLALNFAMFLAFWVTARRVHRTSRGRTGPVLAGSANDGT